MLDLLHFTEITHYLNLFCVTAFVLFKVGEIFLRLLAVAITTGLGLFPISDILIKEIGVSERNQKEMKETQIKN